MHIRLIRTDGDSTSVRLIFILNMIVSPYFLFNSFLVKSFILHGAFSFKFLFYTVYFGTACKYNYVGDNGNETLLN